eukprot:Skav234804  [mRNA]  locus=scaffold69:461712:469404:- [translate_table: standard]
MGYRNFNDVWACNGTTWTQIPAASPWQPRTGLCSVVLPTKALGIFGGNGRYVQEPWRDLFNRVPQKGRQCMQLAKPLLIDVFGGYDAKTSKPLSITKPRHERICFADFEPTESRGEF